MMSSVSPSASRSHRDSPDRLASGSTAIEGLSGSGRAALVPCRFDPLAGLIPPPATGAGADQRQDREHRRERGLERERHHVGAARTAVPSTSTLQVSIGSAMFLSRCGPMGAKWKASLPLT